MSRSSPEELSARRPFGRRVLSTIILSVATLAGILTLAPGVRAVPTFTITMQQQGANVVATGSGFLTLGGLTFFRADGAEPSVSPGGGVLALGGGGPGTAYVGLTAFPVAFGPGLFAHASSATGPLLLVSRTDLIIPVGYVSGTFFSDSATWNDSTLSSLGLTLGSYLYTWGSGETAGSLQVDILSAPEPASLALLGFGVAGLGAIRRFRANRPRN